jgi:hypothetical protein
MSKWKAFFLVTASAFLLAQPLAAVWNEDQCQLVVSKEKVWIKRCQIAAPVDRIPAGQLNLVYLKGTEQEMAFAHGFYFAEELDQGLVGAVVAEKQKMLSGMPQPKRALFASIAQCLFNHYRLATPQNFRDVLHHLYLGYHQRGRSKLTDQDFFEAAMAVELDIYVEGLMKKVKDNPIRAAAEIGGLCGFQVPVLALQQAIGELKKRHYGSKFGCTGIGAADGYTQNGKMILSRNFDSTLLGIFDRQPAIIFFDPQGGYKHVGIAAAGMHYAGGITGFNEKGIAVSLHEMSTEETGVTTFRKRRTPAVEVQSRILAQAASIDEAWRIAGEVNHFGAWTVFIGDAKTGEFASIEFSGKRVRLANRRYGARAQTNHFLSPDMKDAAFEYSYNKTLESRGRYHWLEKELARDQGKIDVQWMVDHLSGHYDNWEGLRSFGRTVTKAYQNASHIMVPEDRQLWLALGDSYPVSEGTFAGYQVNFDFGSDATVAAPFSFVGVTRSSRTGYEKLEYWQESLKHYVLAFISYAEGNLELSEQELTRAVTLAQKDHITEPPYLYIRGRLNLLRALRLIEKAGNGADAAGLLSRAVADFDTLLKDRDDLVLHPYQRGLAYLWAARTLMAFGPESSSPHNELAQKYLQQALNYHQKELAATDRPYFLQRLIESYYEARQNRFKAFDLKAVADEKIEFITIE